MTVRAIGLDLDDTLYDRNRLYKAAFTTMEAEIIETGLDFETFNPVFQKYSELEYELFMAGTKDKDSYSNARVVRTYAEFGFNIDMADGQYFNDLYQQNQKRITLRPAVANCLKLVNQQDLTPFILTNGAEVGQRKKLDLLHIEDFIHPDQFFISGVINISKPDIEIFKRVEKRLDIEAQHILYIGDNLENDVHGALNAGWQAIWFDEHHQASGQEDFPVIHSFEDLYTILENL